MILRRKAEMEMRLQLAKKRRRPVRGQRQGGRLCSRALCKRCRRSKLVSLGANFVGAVGCILCNKYVMRDFDLPLTLTFFGYSVVSLSIVVGRARRGNFWAWNALRRTLFWRGLRRLGGRQESSREEQVFDESERSLLVMNDIEAATVHPKTALPNEASLSRRGGRLRRGLLIACTALAPALANASLQANSVGFTQLSKVLTTPAIILLERSRGLGAPMTWSRLSWLIAAHLGVGLASVADVTISRYGIIIAAINVAVTAKYKVEWNKTCRERVKYLTAQLATDTLFTPSTNSDREVNAVSQVVEFTLPLATLCLLPIALLFEGPTAVKRFQAMDTSGILTLLLAALLGAWTSFTGYQVIGRLSALAHQVLGQAKMCCLILSSYFLLGADLNATQLTGAALTMTSIIFYTKATIDQRIALDKHQRNNEEEENPKKISSNNNSPRRTVANKLAHDNAPNGRGSPRIRRQVSIDPGDMSRTITVATTTESNTAMQQQGGGRGSSRNSLRQQGEKTHESRRDHSTFVA